jgi:translation initiation factor IF-2
VNNKEITTNHEQQGYMASIGTKLFKIASQINVGKETIVAFLQAKGFSVENKATSTLSDDMVELVMDNFQKEASAAEKQRQKTAPAAVAASGATELHDAEPFTGQESAAVLEDAAASVSATAQSHDVGATSNLSNTVEEQAPHSAATVTADTEHSDEKRDNGVAVGTVITLDNDSSRRRGKKNDATEDGQARDTQIAKTKGFPAKGVASKSDAMEIDSKEGAEQSLEQSSQNAHAEMSGADVVGAVQSVHTDTTASADIPENRADFTEASSIQQESSVPTLQEPLSNDDVAGVSTVTSSHTENTDELPSGTAFEASTDGAIEDTADGGLPEEDSAKRKRKKRIGEMEYFVDNAPYSTPMPTGLTILGKMDLSVKRNPAPKPVDRQEDRPQRGGSGSTGGGGSYGNTGSGDRRGGGGNFPPRGGGGTGAPGKPPVTSGPPKPKDWTKEGTGGGAPKKPALGTSTGSSTGGNAAANKKKRKKGKRDQVNADDVDKAIRRTLAGQEESQLAMRTRLRQRRKQERADEQDRQAELREAEEGILRVTEFITVAELANLMNVPTNDIILKCMGLGLMVSINQRLEKDTISLIADDYEYEVEFEDAFSEEALEEDDEDDVEFLTARAPIVTVMGHVDHGKTSLLDYIRNTSVVSGESGGITQHIGAYSVKMTNDKFITFLDTPGHQAFTAMRARGAQVTDLVVLVVAADDNVMPQTIEAISHARAANVPMVVAINKIDKADANPDKVRQQLADQGVLVEEWGGKFQSTMISAKKGTNIDQLLEKILLEAEILNLRANADRLARGTVVEAKIDKGKGPVATVIVQKGTLKVGDAFLCGVYSGRVRAMFNEKGERVEEVIPSTPVQILGFDGVPQSGDTFVAMESEVEAREIATTRQQIKREQDFKRVRHVTLDDIASRIKAGGVQDLKIVLKADTDGSLEALTDSLQKISTEEVKVSIILRAVGAITESDVMLAAASEAIIVGFHVRPSPQSAKLAETEGVDVRLYRIIYDCINEIHLALEGMLQPEIREEVVGVAEVREVFKISKLGNIAGCYMLDGKINRNDTVRVMRDGFEVFTGRLASLKRVKEDVREVDTGFECGIAIDGFNDIQTGDLIEAVRKIEIKRKL